MPTSTMPLTLFARSWLTAVRQLTAKWSPLSKLMISGSLILPHGRS